MYRMYINKVVSYTKDMNISVCMSIGVLEPYPSGTARVNCIYKPGPLICLLKGNFSNTIILCIFVLGSGTSPRNPQVRAKER